MEGSEPEVIESLLLAPQLSIGVMQVEVRGDGHRGRVMRALQARGLSYVGQLRAVPSPANEIIDDVFVNLTHMQRHFPASCMFSHLQEKANEHGVARAAGSSSRSARGAFPPIAPGGAPMYTTFEQQIKHMEEKERQEAAARAAGVAKRAEAEAKRLQSACKACCKQSVCQQNVCHNQQEICKQNFSFSVADGEAVTPLNATTRRLPESRCHDKMPSYPTCAHAASVGKCKRPLFRDNCRRSCGFCVIPPSPPPQPSS